MARFYVFVKKSVKRKECIFRDTQSLVQNRKEKKENFDHIAEPSKKRFSFEATKKWTMPLRNRGRVYGEFQIMYEGRLPE